MNATPFASATKLASSGERLAEEPELAPLAVHSLEQAIAQRDPLRSAESGTDCTEFSWQKDTAPDH